MRFGRASHASFLQMVQRSRAQRIRLVAVDGSVGASSRPIPLRAVLNFGDGGKQKKSVFDELGTRRIRTAIPGGFGQSGRVLTSGLPDAEEPGRPVWSSRTRREPRRGTLHDGRRHLAGPGTSETVLSAFPSSTALSDIGRKTRYAGDNTAADTLAVVV